ncbi:TRAP-type C4-dicarboxylate transport system, periplasmic component [plant metagenome]|uniref:TRAP-type C4-dicarboxylate transport system, periplasmic component n=1 Tax=plant metagenome TaxID=1297885 RepID=A0A484SFD7_9ZZZZ
MTSSPEFVLRRRKALSFGAAAAIAAVVPPAYAQSRPVTLKVATATINDVNHHWMTTFKAAVEARADGRIKVDLFPASQLGAIPRMVEGVALGTIECFVTATSFLTNLDTRFQVFDMPGVLDDTAHAVRVFSRPEVRSLVGGFGNGKGMVPLAMFMHSPQTVVARRPIQRIADFQGLKIRVLSSPLQVEPLRKVGASPVPMPLSEVMPALQNGAIDGVITASTVSSALKFYDAAKFQTELPQWPVVVVSVFNQNWLGRLPADLRTIVQEEAAKAEGPTNAFGAGDIGAAREVWTRNGGQIVALAANESATFAKTASETATSVLQQNAAAKEAFDRYAAAALKAKD